MSLSGFCEGDTFRLWVMVIQAAPLGLVVTQAALVVVDPGHEW